jgi:hypothetical protein
MLRQFSKWTIVFKRQKLHSWIELNRLSSICECMIWKKTTVVLTSSSATSPQPNWPSCLFRWWLTLMLYTCVNMENRKIDYQFVIVYTDGIAKVITIICQLIWFLSYFFLFTNLAKSVKTSFILPSWVFFPPSCCIYLSLSWPIFFDFIIYNFCLYGRHQTGDERGHRKSRYVAQTFLRWKKNCNFLETSTFDNDLNRNIAFPLTFIC